MNGVFGDDMEYVVHESTTNYDSTGSRSGNDSGGSSFVESLIDRIENLEARLGLTPQNSSLPPSSQHPHAKPPRPKRKGRKKKRGGQPGHPSINAS